MLACQDKKKLDPFEQGFIRNHSNLREFCMDRYFERLPGLVDVKVLTTYNAGEQPSLLDPAQPSAYPICHLKKLTEEQLSLYSSLMEQAHTSMLADLDHTISEINRLNQECLTNYATITKDLD